MNALSDSDLTQVVEDAGNPELSPNQKQGSRESLHLGRLNIGPRLGLCFLVIVALMLAGYGLLLWQFHLLHIQGNRLNAVGQELIAVSRFQTDFFRLNARLDELGKSEDIDGLRKEAGPLRTLLVSDTDQARNVIARLPADLHPDPTVVPTLEVIQSTLPSQLEKITALAEVPDWEAVRERLANEKKPLEADVAALVRTVEQQVSKELAAALMESVRAQHRILIIVPATAIFTLLVAAFLGLAVTRSITRPLGRLVAGSRALAKGDFSHRIQAEGDDELAKVGEVFNDAASRLRSLYNTLQRKEAYLSEAQRLAHCASWAWNVRTGELFWSEEMFRILAYDPAVTSPDWVHFLDRVHPEDLPLVEQRAAIENSERDWVDPGSHYRIVLPDGKVKYLFSIAYRVLDESHQVLEVVGTTMDVTESTQAQEKLRRSEAFLTEGQTLARIGNFSWLVETDEIKWSEQLYRIFEFEPGVPISFELIRSRVHPEDLTMMHEMIERGRGGASHYEYEHRLLMPDDSVKYLHLVAHANRDQAGRLEYLGAVQDVTQRRFSEQAVNKARSELAKESRINALGVLTASIAHEVNQPLSGIITNASTCLRMLSADPPNVEGARETARRTIRDGNRASDVITRLRTLYGKKDLQPELMDLNEAAREVSSLSLSDLQRNRVIVRHEFADDIPPVTADRIQLQQVILNLLRNASDAMSTIDDRPRELLIRTERDDRVSVRLSVKDTGIGFAPQTAERLFESFYTTKNDGMGIGLSISRSIIEAHRGRLWATPNDGPGATFSFVIPCTRDGEPST